MFEAIFLRKVLPDWPCTDWWLFRVSPPFWGSEYIIVENHSCDLGCDHPTTFYFSDILGNKGEVLKYLDFSYPLDYALELIGYESDAEDLDL